MSRRKRNDNPKNGSSTLTQKVQPLTVFLNVNGDGVDKIENVKRSVQAEKWYARDLTQFDNLVEF